MKRFTKQVCRLYQYTVALFFSACAIWLMVSALLFTNFLSEREVSSIQADRAWMQILLILLFCCLCLFGKKVWTRQASLHKKSPLRGALILAAGLCACIWVSQVQLTPIYDAREVQLAALELLGVSEASKFGPGDYIARYPHQCGLVLFQWLLAKVVGAANLTVAFQYCNVLAYMVALYCLGDLCAAIGMGERGCLAATILGVLFLPLLFYVTFVYGTLLGLASALAGLVCAISFCRSHRWYQALGSTVLLFLSMVLKSNYQIFVIGTILYSFFTGLDGKHRNWWLTGGLILSFFLAGRLPVTILEVWTGADLHHGYTPLSWLGIGLIECEGQGGPGWWNGYANYTYDLCGMDPTLQRAYVANELEDLLAYYLQHPRSAARFFLRKNASQWSEPLFAGLWLNQNMAFTNNTQLPLWAETLCSQEGQNFLRLLLNPLQSILYSGLVFWSCLPVKRKHSQEELLLAVILVGGFLFHTFWEAKSQYTLPYYVLSFPLAIQGYRNLVFLHSHRGEIAWSQRSRFYRFRCLLPIALLILALALSLCPMLLLYPQAI